MEHIEITFRFIDGRYVFASADNKILIEHTNRDKAAALFFRLLKGLERKGTTCRIEAYAPLGPALKLLRDAGAICRVGLQNSPTPPEPEQHWRNRGASNVEERPVPPPIFLSWSDYLSRTTDKERMAWCTEKAKRANRRDGLPYLPWLEGLPRIECRFRICNSPVGWCSKSGKCDPSSNKSVHEDRAVELIGQTPLAVRQKLFDDTMRDIVSHADKNHPLRPKSKITKHDVWALMLAAQGRCAYCGSLAVERAPTSPISGRLDVWAQVGRRIGSLDHIASAENNPDNLAWCCLWCNTWPEERRPLAADHGGYYPTD